MFNRVSKRYILRCGAAALGFVPVLIAGSAHAQSTDAPPKGTDEIVVQGERQHYRGDVQIKDLPQSIQVIGSAEIKDLGITRLQDALDLASGVSRQNTFGGVWDSFAIRGFAGDPNTPSGYLVNGFQGGRGFGGIRDTASIDRIEVMKGPGSALYGRGEPGGTINIITKKPQFDWGANVSMLAGSYNRYRGEADVTGPVVADKVAIRLIGSYTDADSFRDTVHTRFVNFAPSILAKLGNTQLSYELEYSHQKLPFDRGVIAVNGVLGKIPNSRYLGEPGDDINTAKVVGHQFEVEQKLGANWHARAGVGYRKTWLDGAGQTPELVVARQSLYTTGDILSRQRRLQNIYTNDFTIRGEVDGRFDTGPFTHHILMGADWEKFKIDLLTTRSRPPVYNSSLTLQQINGINIYKPVYGYIAPPVETIYNDIERQKAYGFYVNDQIDLTEKLKIRLGIRRDYFRQTISPRSGGDPSRQRQEVWNPQIGAVYNVTNEISAYATWSKGFRPNSGTDVAGTPFAPERTTSYEGGLKLATRDRKLAGTIAVFHLEKDNVIIGDPRNQGFSIAMGKARSEGVEFDLTGELPSNMHLAVAYAYVVAQAATTVLDPDFGKTVNKGDSLLNVPKNSGNILLTKDLIVGGRTVTVGGSVNYVGKRRGETGAPFFLPSYTSARVLAAVDINDSLRINGEISNLFNKTYYLASYSSLWIAPGPPRQFSVRATYSFR